jgi:hypothetical protein
MLQGPEFSRGTSQEGGAVFVDVRGGASVRIKGKVPLEEEEGGAFFFVLEDTGFDIALGLVELV